MLRKRGSGHLSNGGNRSKVRLRSPDRRSTSLRSLSRVSMLKTLISTSLSTSRRSSLHSSFYLISNSSSRKCWRRGRYRRS